MKRWLAVWTKPRQEARAVEHLRRQAFEVFCPVANERRRLHDSNRWVTVPLFPRYIFAHVNTDQQSVAPIRSTLGCVDLVRVGGRPATVPGDIVQALLAKPVTIDPATDWRPDEALEVVAGPFAGLTAIFKCRCAGDRVRVLIELLDQWHPAELPAAILSRA